MSIWRSIKSFLTPPQAAAARIIIVALVVEDDDRRLLANIGERHRWDLHFANTCEEARELGAPIILCDRNLPGKEWRQVVQALASSRHNACVILISKVMDDYLRNEVARTGGYDVLSKPLQEADVVRAVKLASSYWNSTMSVG